MTVRGDWNDVEAAVEAAASNAEFAVLTREERGPASWAYTILTIDDREGSLTISRSTEAADPVDIAIDCRVGLAGDPRRETRIKEEIGRRLIRLRGVDAAPLR